MLKNLKFGVIEGLYVLAPASAIWLFTASFLIEFRKMIENNAFNIIAENPMTFIIASFMGLGVNFFSYLVIQATSSLTMKVLGTARNIFVIVAGVLLYGEAITMIQLLGYLIALIGFLGYNAAQMGHWTNIETPFQYVLYHGNGILFGYKSSALQHFVDVEETLELVSKSESK